VFCIFIDYFTQSGNAILSLAGSALVAVTSAYLANRNRTTAVI